MSELTVETDPEKIAAAIAKINQSPMLSKGNDDSTGGLASENMTVWDEYFKSVAPRALSVSIDKPGIPGDYVAPDAAMLAAEFADAMMAERNKRGS